MTWKNYTVAQMKELIKVLEKITEFKGSKLHVKAIHGGEEIKVSGAPTITTEYKSKIELADLEKKSAMKKKIKAQAEGAKADAAAIKPPFKTIKLPKKTVAPAPPPQPKSAAAIKPPTVAEATDNLEKEKQGAIKAITYTFNNDRQKKQITKFINDKIKSQDDLFKWLKIFSSPFGNEEEIPEWRIKDDVFSNSKKATEWEDYQFIKKGGNLNPMFNKMEEEWRLFRNKIAAKRQIKRRGRELDMYF